MTRRKTVLCATCFLGVTSFVTFAWTQQPAPAPIAASEDFLAEPDLSNSVPGFVFAQFGADAGGRTPTEPPPPIATTVKSGQFIYGLGVGQMRPKTVSETVHRVIWEPISSEENEQNQAFMEAIQALKDSKDDESKKKASNTVREQLTKQFERDLAEREKELAAVEERLKSLRQQLEKRKTSKEEIIGLRLKTIVNNAEGLGFPGEDALPENTAGNIAPAAASRPSVGLFPTHRPLAPAEFTPRRK